MASRIKELDYLKCIFIVLMIIWYTLLISIPMQKMWYIPFTCLLSLFFPAIWLILTNR